MSSIIFANDTVTITVIMGRAVSMYLNREHVSESCIYWRTASRLRLGHLQFEDRSYSDDVANVLAKSICGLHHGEYHAQSAQHLHNTTTTQTPTLL